MRARVLRILCAALLTGAAGTAAGGGPARAEEGAQVVNCYDAARKVVQKTVRRKCTGTILSDAEAAKVSEERRAYMRRAFRQQPGQAPQGGHDKGRVERFASGFFVSADGDVLTSYHVVAQCQRVTVSPAVGPRADAEVVASHEGINLAVLSTNLRPTGIARFAAYSRPPANRDVNIVGYPNPDVPASQPRLTEGKTQGTRDMGGGYVLTIRAALRDGNNGSPVIDDNGEVLGVIFAKVDTALLYKRTGQFLENISFAVPNLYTTDFLNEHNVPYLRGGQGTTFRAGPLAAAQPFVARIDCWN